MADKEYYYIKNNESIGPLSLMDLLEIIDRETMVWHDGIEWTIACEIDELKKFFPVSISSTPEMMYYYSSESSTYGPFDLAQLLYKIDSNTLVWREGINWTKACELEELQKFFPAKIDNEISELSNTDDFVSTESNGDLNNILLKNGGGSKKALIIGGTVFAMVIIGAVVFFGMSGRDKKIATPITQEAPKIKSISAQSIILDVSSKVLKVDEKLQLKATITPQNATDQNLVWESGDNSVATVSNGLVTTLSKGTTVLKVSLLNTSLSATCKIIVEDISKKSQESKIDNNSITPEVPQASNKEVRIGNNDGNNSEKSGKTSNKITKTLKFDFGNYNGETINELRDGKGTMFFTQKQLISPNDLQKRYAETGDYVIGTWVGGNLVNGTLFDKNGEKKGSLYIGQ